MLNPNEAVWLDHFFSTVITPIFFCETLADLEKPDVRISAEHEVAVVARKTPQAHCVIHALHRTICIADLMGQHLPMDGRPVLPAGIPVKVDGRDQIVFRPAPEMEAFARWQDQDFDTVERDFAKRWREDLGKLSYDGGERQIRHLGIDVAGSNSFAEVAETVRRFIATTNDRAAVLITALVLLQISAPQAEAVLLRWQRLAQPSLSRFAPYASHVLTVDLSLYAATSRGIVSRDRPSNRLDFAYLYYLPFCQVFASDDKLHKMCVPCFLRPEQEFMTGADLKRGLRETQDYFSSIPEVEREKGLDALAPWPPKNSSLVSQLWDRHAPAWRSARQEAAETTLSDELKSKLVDDIRRMSAAAHKPADTFPAEGNVQGLVVERRVHARRGDWWQIPKALDEEASDEK